MRTYKVSIPIINECITEENRETYFKMLREAEADRVVLTFHGVFACDIPALHQNIAFFKERGFDVALWVGHTVGHIGAEFPFAETELPYQRILRRDGTPAENTFCPFDPAFQMHIGKKLAEIVRDADVRLVMLDDDCTTTQKGFGCTCERHLERMHHYLGETPDRAFLAKQTFTGKGNRYRTAWMNAQRDGIESFAKVLREQVSAVRPDITLSICTVFGHWSFDGLDMPTLSKTLAGGRRRCLSAAAHELFRIAVGTV